MPAGDRQVLCYYCQDPWPESKTSLDYDGRIRCPRCQRIGPTERQLTDANRASSFSSRRATVSGGTVASPEGICLMDAPSALVPVHSSTRLIGSVEAKEGAELTSVSVYSGTTLLGGATLGTRASGSRVSTPWSYEWTPGAEAVWSDVMAVAHFGNATESSSVMFDVSADLRCDFSKVGHWSGVWLADRGLTVTGADVDAWEDFYSGHAYPYVPPGAQPTLSATAWDGSPAVSFVPNQYLVCSESGLIDRFEENDANTVFAVAHDCVTASNIIVGLYGASTANKAEYLIEASKADRYTRGAVYSTTPTAAPGRRHTVCGNVGTSVQIFRNGVDTHSVPGTVNAAAMGFNVISLGARYIGGTPSVYMTGNVAAVLVGVACTDPPGLSTLLSKLNWGYA